MTSRTKGPGGVGASGHQTPSEPRLPACVYCEGSYRRGYQSAVASRLIVTGGCRQAKRSATEANDYLCG